MFFGYNLYRIGDDIPNREFIPEVFSPDANSATCGNGVELEGNTSCLPDACLYRFGKFSHMAMTWSRLIIGIYYADMWALEICSAISACMVKRTTSGSIRTEEIILALVAHVLLL
jgi:hypothetical protein